MTFDCLQNNFVLLHVKPDYVLETFEDIIKKLWGLINRHEISTVDPVQQRNYILVFAFSPFLSLEFLKHGIQRVVNTSYKGVGRLAVIYELVHFQMSLLYTSRRLINCRRVWVCNEITDPVRSSSGNSYFFRSVFQGEKFVFSNKPFIKTPSPTAKRIHIQGAGSAAGISRGTWRCFTSWVNENLS